MFCIKTDYCHFTHLGGLTSSDCFMSIAMAARRWTPGGQSFDPWRVPTPPDYYAQMKDCVPRLPGPLRIAIPCVGGFSAGRAALKILHQDDVRFVNIFDKDPDLDSIGLSFNGAGLKGYQPHVRQMLHKCRISIFVRAPSFRKNVFLIILCAK